MKAANMPDASAARGPLTISRQGDLACSVFDEQGRHVGNLKLINAVWKFKAIGYDEHSRIVPGGGPLTYRHNTLFASLNIDDINAGLLHKSP